MTNFRKWFVAVAALTLATGNTLNAQSSYTISTYAGGLPSTTSASGPIFPMGNINAVATDRFGNTYASTTLHCVFRLDPNGVLSRVAGVCRAGFSGDGGSALSAQLNNPQGLALDSAGNLYIADQSNQRVRQVTPSGVISTIAGTGVQGFSADNVLATTSQLSLPEGVAVDAQGNVYIADRNNNRIRKVVVGGNITTIVGNGTGTDTGDGSPATAATVQLPASLAFNPQGDLYIGDAANVRKVSGGNISHIVGPGLTPYGVAVDSFGNLFVADRNNFRVLKIDTTGAATTYAGGNNSSLGDGGPATSAQLSGPTGVALDYSGNLYIADQGYRLRKVNPQGIISTAAGTGAAPFSGDGSPAVMAQFSGNWGIARDANSSLPTFGNLYIADTSNFRVRKISSGGVVSTVAGKGVSGYTGDGGQATNAAIQTTAVAVDPATGSLYLGDSAVIRKVDTTGKITTVAGTGSPGNTGDTGPATAATLSPFIRGLVVDSHGDLYIADYSNHVIRKVTMSATPPTINTVAGIIGSKGFSGDGLATAETLNFPNSLAIDSSDNVYIGDSLNFRVRKLSGGNLTTVAGNGTQGSTGDTGLATSAALNVVYGLAVDGAGNIFVASDGNTVREVTGGKIYTVAGNGLGGYSGDGGPATSAQLFDPFGLALDGTGNLYVSDLANGVIRLLQPAQPVLTITKTHSGNFTAGQGSANYSIVVSNAASAGPTSGTVTVTEEIPSGLNLISMNGTNWNCATLPVCTRSDSLPAGQHYDTITVNVSVNSGAPPQVTNIVMVSGGGAQTASNEDPTFIGSAAPVLEISLTHTGNFLPGQSGVTYSIAVANQPNAAPTSGAVTVTNTLPLTGLTFQSMSGGSGGWSCAANSCNRSDALAGGAVYPPITVTFNVGSSPPSQVTNQATVSGGGSNSATANDVTNILSQACDVTGDGQVTVADVQAVINEALGKNPAQHDLNLDHVVNITDIQIIITAVLFGGCPV